MTELDLKCRCGRTRLALDIPRHAGGLHLVCYCTDCQANARLMGKEDTLTPGGGTDIYQTLPSRLRVVAGAENLACLRLTERGPLRWYAACCDTPVATTLPTAAVPFAGIVVGALSDPAARDAALGPPTLALFRDEARPGAPAEPSSRGMRRQLGRVALRTVGAVLRQDTVSPFFDGRTPRAVPREVHREPAP